MVWGVKKFQKILVALFLALFGKKMALLNLEPLTTLSTVKSCLKEEAINVRKESFVNPLDFFPRRRTTYIRKAGCIYIQKVFSRKFFFAIYLCTIMYAHIQTMHLLRKVSYFIIILSSINGFLTQHNNFFKPLCAFKILVAGVSPTKYILTYSR